MANVRFFSFLLLFLSLTASALSQEPFSADETEEEDGSAKTSDISPKEAMMVYAYVADRVKREYVEPVNNNKLLEGALNGMLSNLDPHSAYLNPEKFEEINKQTQGKFGGLGLEITIEDGLTKVVAPMEDTPAFEAGIKTGDYIIMIDRVPVLGQSIIDVAKKLRGDPGTEVTLLIRRKDRPPFELTLKRAIVNVKPVKWRIIDNIGYLRLTTFNERAASDLKKAIQDIKRKVGPKLVGFILDLRNNVGGLFEQSIEVSDMFLNAQEVVSIRERNARKIHRFMATQGDIAEGIPIIVIINAGSASASEIVAGALQAHKRALIVGTKSFGKGSVQTIFPMTNGGAIKLTTALFYTPAGKVIQKAGIQPDIVIEQPASDKEINEEYRIREESLPNSLNGEGIPSTQEPEMEALIPAPSQEQKKQKDKKHKDSTNNDAEADDHQLMQAVTILKKGNIFDKKNFKHLKKTNKRA
jgi:carboxyl-terminal processing protease